MSEFQIQLYLLDALITELWKAMSSTHVGDSENSFFFQYFDNASPLFTLYSIPAIHMHLSFIHICHFYMLSLAVW